MTQEHQLLINRLNKPIIIPNPCVFGIKTTEIDTMPGGWQSSFKKVLIEHGWQIKVGENGEEDYIAPMENKSNFFRKIFIKLGLK